MELGWNLVKKEKDFLKVRRSVKFLCEELGFNKIDTIKTLTATSELVRNIYEYASEGKVFYHLIFKENKIGLQLIFKDQGGGIENLDEILNGGKSPGSSVGLTSAKKLSDEFNIDTKIGKGTTIETIKWLNAHKTFSKKDVNELIQNLAVISEDSIIETLKAQNKYFIELIDEYNKKNMELIEIKNKAIREISESNKEYLMALEELNLVRKDLEGVKKMAMEEIANADHEYLVTLNQLEITQTELKNIIEELDLYVKIISHDLKEPLIVTIRMLELIKQRFKDKFDLKLDKFINSTIESANHMKNLMNDLLKYSKIPSSKENFDSTDIGQIVQEIINDLSLEIERNNVVITCDSLPTLMVNPTLIRQVFHNLIQNAIKFKREDHVSIHISAEKNSESYIISVRDNGIGIEMEKAKHIFLIFKRLHTEEEYPGTGLGLAISEKIIKNHGGKIWVESEIGKGSTFYFTIPTSKINQ